jgi:4-hydroxy-tetrahydrodipicolinate synthase
MTLAGGPTHPPDWLRGLFAVIPTPMRPDGALDLASLDRVVDHYQAAGATGLVPVSVAGEGDLLSAAERQQVIQRVVQRTAGRMPVCVGVLQAQTRAAVQQAQEAARCGARGLLVLPPRVGPAGILDHFQAIARAVSLPLVVLDHPRLGPPLPPPLLQALTEAVPWVCGIKLEDEPTPAKMARVRALLGQRLRVFGGLSGAHCLQELAHGADGFFTGLPRPGHLVAMMARFRAGDHPGAAVAFAAMQSAIQQERENPAGMITQRKALLCAEGVIEHASTRLPM